MKENNKEKILADFRKKLYNFGKIQGVSPTNLGCIMDMCDEYFNPALDEYADLKIKEKIKEIDGIAGRLGATGIGYSVEAVIKEILLNKDKK